MKKGCEKTLADLNRSPAWSKKMIEALICTTPEMTVVAKWHARPAGKTTQDTSVPEADVSLETPIAPAA